MRISMKRIAAASLFAALTLASLNNATASPAADRGTRATSVQVTTTNPAPAAAGDLVGTGIVQKLACMACAGTFIAATGTGSIAALIIVVGLNPELATACVVGCIAAFA
ncbi:MAG TPA: hypothetical protein VGD77_13435 [Gemmatimonadaceae bacterium]